MNVTLEPGMTIHISVRFSMSLRTESPKLEMYRHLALDRGVTDLHCPVVFDINDQLTCDLPDVIARDEGVDPAVIYAADHVYAGANVETAPTVVMYGELGTGLPLIRRFFIYI